MRADVWQKADTPNMDKLSQNGIFSTHAVTEIVTTSGSCWSSLLKGVHLEKHKVFGNDFSKTDQKYKTFFELVKEKNPTMKIIAHSNWKPILDDVFNRKSLDISSSGSDKKMVKRMVKDISKGKGDLYFIQLDECDHAGHTFEYKFESPKYVAQVELTDFYVGKIMDAVKSRPNDEDWLICVASDHGGNGKGHGNQTIGELNIVFIISGNAVENLGEIPFENEDDELISEDSPGIVDFVPSIATFLGFSLDKDWDGISRI